MLFRLGVEFVYNGFRLLQVHVCRPYLPLLAKSNPEAICPHSITACVLLLYSSLFINMSLLTRIRTLTSLFPLFCVNYLGLIHFEPTYVFFFFEVSRFSDLSVFPHLLSISSYMHSSHYLCVYMQVVGRRNILFILLKI
ncbi:hypothetical protein F4820DRAFT_42303 [Hypoxylon rubiginosum]|uniref:Uncharacterized protein n=1 Tax=Hypoxylon rubiginosum TaxID=110542 RepID=A0ACB9YRB0_9PEZI|nr:hypothetical protein F4820DRAFT_42303 [Hypoxylon rubiginosum]